MSAPKAKKGSEAPAWIVTFADLMSLLLTFFVLLLSFSSMETEQYKKLAGTMRESFGLQSFDRYAGLIELEGGVVGIAPKDVTPIPLPETDIESKVGPEPLTEATIMKLTPKPETSPEADTEANQRTFDELQTVLADEIASNVMDVESTGNVTIVRFPDQVSFPSGSGELKDEFLPVLGKFLSVLEHSEGHIVISGHTDDIPISTAQYRSNWDLSASRAISVAHFILAHTSIQASRITVQGYADSRPLVPNTNMENRTKNRRVEITIQTVEKSLPKSDNPAQD